MDLTSKEAFRLGFLTRCAEEGLTGKTLQARIKLAAEKTASPAAPIAYGANALMTLGILQGLGGIVRGLGESAYTLAQHGGQLAFGLPAAAGLAAGGLGGYAAAKFNEPNVTDDDVKAQEIADTYRMYAQRLNTHRKLRDTYRSAR